MLPSLFALPSDALPAVSENAVRAKAETCHLERGEVIHLEQTRQFKKIEVKSGVVWLTGTPADDDVILKQDQIFEFQNRWPYVIEAIEAAKISLT